MNKAIGIFASVAAVGGLTAALLLGGGEKGDFDLDYGNFRLAIADQACPEQEGDPGWVYMNNKCVWTISRAGYCGCFTHDSELLTGELTPAEVEDLKLTHPNWFRDIGVCEATIAGIPQRWVMVVPYYCDNDGDCPATSTCHPTVHRCLPGPTWTCVAIKRGIPRVLVTHAASMGPLTLAMREKCCAGCDPGEKCAVRPASWGICPYCLLDGAGACDSLCLPPEVP